MKIWMLLLAVACTFAAMGCFSWGKGCGDEYYRNMTYVWSGWYRLDATDAGSGEVLPGVKRIHVVKQKGDGKLRIETDDGRVAVYQLKPR